MSNRACRAARSDPSEPSDQGARPDIIARGMVMMEDRTPMITTITAVRMIMPSRGQNRPLVTGKESKIAIRFWATVMGTARQSRTANQIDRATPASPTTTATRTAMRLPEAWARPAARPTAKIRAANRMIQSSDSTTVTTTTRTSSMPSRR